MTITVVIGLAVLGPWSIPVIAAARVDASSCRLPNRIVLPGLAVTLALAAAVAAARTDVGPFVRACVGASLMALTFLLAHLFRPNGLGFGDVKYGALIGAGLGALTPVLVLLAYVLAVPAHAAALRWRWWPAQRQAHAPCGVAPFGPALALGAALALLIVFVIHLAGS